jgi:hypothetical protein
MMHAFVPAGHKGHILNIFQRFGVRACFVFRLQTQGSGNPPQEVASPSRSVSELSNSKTNEHLTGSAT